MTPPKRTVRKEFRDELLALDVHFLKSVSRPRYELASETIAAIMTAYDAAMKEVIGPNDRDYSKDNAGPEELKTLVMLSDSANDLRRDQRSRAGIGGE